MPAPEPSEPPLDIETNETPPAAADEAPAPPADAWDPEAFGGRE
jgi:hypothetical protein